MLSGRLVTSHIIWHEHLPTLSIVVLCVWDCYEVLGIEDYFVVVCVCYMIKYVGGAILFVWLFCEFGGDTQQRFGWDPDCVVLDSSNQAPLSGLAFHGLERLLVD